MHGKKYLIYTLLIIDNISVIFKNRWPSLASQKRKYFDLQMDLIKYVENKVELLQ